MDVVIWENPPIPTRGPGVRESAEANTLRSNPNQWGRVFEFDKPFTASATANTIKKGTRKGFEPAGSFEATARTINGKGVVFARFVGEDSSSNS